MEHRPDLLLKSAVKSLRDNVAPSIDPANSQAIQQCEIAARLIEIALERMPETFRYDLVELRELAELGRRIGASLGSDRALDTTVADASALLERARVDPAELVVHNAALRERIGLCISEANASRPPETARAINRAVLSSAAGMIERERAWALPFGFEADAGAVRALDLVLAEQERPAH